MQTFNNDQLRELLLNDPPGTLEFIYDPGAEGRILSVKDMEALIQAILPEDSFTITDLGDNKFRFIMD